MSYLKMEVVATLIVEIQFICIFFFGTYVWIEPYKISFLAKCYLPVVLEISIHQVNKPIIINMHYQDTFFSSYFEF